MLRCALADAGAPPASDGPPLVATIGAAATDESRRAAVERAGVALAELDEVFTRFDNRGESGESEERPHGLVNRACDLAPVWMQLVLLAPDEV